MGPNSAPGEAEEEKVRQKREEGPRESRVIGEAGWREQPNCYTAGTYLQLPLPKGVSIFLSFFFLDTKAPQEKKENHARNVCSDLQCRQECSGAL